MSEDSMTNSTFSVPIEERYFEDYVPGSVYEFGSVKVEEQEIIEFAKKYDPQVFHMDPEGAKKTRFGGLIASGWHTAAIAMRMLVDHFISRVASMGSPGADKMRWLIPVRPGDELSMRVTILKARPSRSNPEQGIIELFVEVINQKDEVVMTRTAISLMRRRKQQANPT
jgi:acyl dehydratase